LAIPIALEAEAEITREAASTEEEGTLVQM